MKLKQKIQNQVEYALFRFMIWKFRIIPYRLSKGFLSFLFLLVGYHIGIRKKVALTQLKKVYPHLSTAKAKGILKQSYRLMALNAAEEFLLSADEMFSRCSIIGEQNIREGLSFGNGLILATGHFGNWEAARIMPRFKIPTSVITKRQRNRLFDAYTDKIRTECGVTTIDMKRGLRGILEELKRNHMVAILADQNAGKSGLIFDFLGYPASHWLGVAKLSLRYKVPIIPGFAVRTPDEKTVFTFEKLIYHPELEDVPENYELILGEIDEILISYIHRYPEQWFWVHKRWKGAYDMFSPGN